MKRAAMKRLVLFLVFIFAMVAAKPAAAETRIIVRDTLGASALNLVCSLLGCNVQRGLGDPNAQLFLITTPDALDPVMVIAELLASPGITGVEIDQNLSVQGATAGNAPPALYDQTPMNYYGTTVWHGYVYQPANQIIRTLDTQSQFNTAGAGIVAMIDTGVDTTHPVLQSVIVPGYDFVHNTNNPDEKGDLDQSTEAVLEGDGGGQPAVVNQSTEAVLEQSTEAVLEGNPDYAAFGHGTMTAGVVHVVAPKAKIMPLKAFMANGTGYLSDILRAVYYASGHNANVINMSFSFAQPSAEMQKAINYVNNRGLICVAAAGNDGLQTLVYPAASSHVMGIASTDNNDVRSTFSNYGSQLVWVAAPGEGVVTTYPFGHYAAGWGTSFSTPFVAGTSSLLLGVSPMMNQSIAQTAISNAQNVGDPSLHYGRLDTYQAVSNWWSAVATCTLLCSSNPLNQKPVQQKSGLLLLH